MRKQFTLFLLSTCLTILFVVPFVYAQETQTVLKPNQLFTYSLAPEQEKLFVLQMKKGDFAEIQSLVREGVSISFEIYDSARKELLEKSAPAFGYDEGYIWFVAPKDGDFLVVTERWGEISGAEKISIQYNNKLTLPRGTKLKGVRKVNGFDVKILATPESSDGNDGDAVLLIEKNGQLQKAMKRRGDGEYNGITFVNDIHIYNKDDIYLYSTGSVKTNRAIRLTKTTPEIVKRKAKLSGSKDIYFADELPDIVISASTGVRFPEFETFFIKLGDTVKVSQPDALYFTDIGKSPKGGLFFEALEYSFHFWFTAGCNGGCSRGSSTKVILEFRNGKLRPNFELMKKPAPSLAVLRSKAQKFRNQLSLKPYKGANDLNALNVNEMLGPMDDPGLFSKEYSDLDREARTALASTFFSKRVFEPPFWDVMLDLIFTGNEDLAWQFLDLVWPPQKQGKAIFIKDFKNQLLKSLYWQMILEGKEK